MPTHGPDLSRVSLSQLRTLTGRGERTIRKLLAGLEPVDEDGRTRWYDSGAALSRIFNGRPVGGGSRDLARGLLHGLALGEQDWLPWLRDSNLVSLKEYAAQIDVEYEEVIGWLNLGLPTLPPKAGEVGARVSSKHAEIWRTMFSLLLEQLGGDGMAPELSVEARRLAAPA